MTLNALGTPQFSFGSGYLYGIPLQGTATQQTPVLLGTLQDCSYDISSSMKELMGQNQFAVAIGRGPAKFTGKAKMGQFSAAAWNTFFFGPGSDSSAYPVSTGTAVIETVTKEIGSPTTQAWTFANTALGTFDTDLGVYYTLTGQPLAKVAVASTPTIGQYKVDPATGVYTFAVGDSAANAASGITVAYTWHRTIASRWVQAINNNALPMGAAPSFEIVHYVPYSTGGTDLTIKIYGAVSTKLSFGFKNTDFTIAEIDFAMFANAAGKVMDIITNG
jgi:hypothetical protein